MPGSYWQADCLRENDVPLGSSWRMPAKYVTYFDLFIHKRKRHVKRQCAMNQYILQGTHIHENMLSFHKKYILTYLRF